MQSKKIDIRTMLSRDKHQVVDLWKYSFSDSTKEFDEYYFTNRFSPENAVGLFCDGRLEAALQLNPYNLVVGDIISEVKYVVGVSVQPESRGLGYMTDLLKYTLNMQYQNGEDFSILMPIDTNIYTKYGYANCFQKHDFTMDINRINVPRTNYAIRRLDVSAIETAERDLHQLSEIYYDVVSCNHSYISRNSRYWKNRMAELSVEHGEFFVVYDGKLPRGYVMLLSKAKDGIGNVVEMAFYDKNAFYTLMGLIKNHATQFKRVSISTPQPMEFQLLMDFDNQIEHRVRPFMMGRVINAERILDMILYKSEIFGCSCMNFDESTKYAIEINDDYIHDNNIIMICKNKKIIDIIRKPEKKEVGASKPSADLPLLRLSMSVAELAQLYTKSLTLSELARMGKVQISEGEGDINFFERIFGSKSAPSYVNDYV